MAFQNFQFFFSRQLFTRYSRINAEVGNNGTGKYDGEWGFRTYTNAGGVLPTAHRASPTFAAHRTEVTRHFANIGRYLAQAVKDVGRLSLLP